VVAFEQGHALVVGVGADLPNTADDALGLAEILKDPGRCAYPPTHVHLLTGEAATRDAILAAFDTLAQSTSTRSTVLVYFSGHGCRATSPTGEFHYLLPYGYDLNRASSQEDELSFAGRPYSAFTLALIEALCGIGVARHDGYVRVADLALHAREVVPGRTGRRQHPILHFEHADNFVLACYAGGAPAPKGLPFAGTPEIEPEPGAWMGTVTTRQAIAGDHNVQLNLSNVSASSVNVNVREGHGGRGSRPRVCPACGHPVRAGATFCVNCGARLPT